MRVLSGQALDSRVHRGAAALATATLIAFVGSAGFEFGPAFAAAASRSSPSASQPSGSIEGVLRDGSGAPVAGALVAAVPENDGIDEASTRAAATTRSDKRGNFRLAALPAMRYSVTATRRGFPAAYIGEQAVQSGQALRGLDLRFALKGVTLRGHVKDQRGGPLAGAEVRAIRYSDFKGDIFYVRADSAGAYEVTLPVARYYVCAAAPGYEFAGVYADSTGDRAVDVMLDRAFPPGPPPAGVVEWIRANAVPIRTVEAGHGFEDLEPLRETVGAARVVSLGEATHGTREFFQLKHRMLEFLVAQMGFSVFAIEATMPEGFDVNEYVLTGRGDPEKALSGLYFWTWDTEEVLDLIRWMRRWNGDPSHRTKVKFYGMDMQIPTRAAKNVVTFLRRNDPDEASRTASSLGVLASPFLAQGGQNGFSVPDSSWPAIDLALRKLSTRLEASKPSDRAPSSARDLSLARQNLRILQQWRAMTSRNEFFVRDSCMAANVRWILDEGEPGSKVVVWAHNAHVMRADPGAEIQTMGTFLRESLGDDMVVFGFAFDRGSFQAVDGAATTARVIRPFTVGLASAGSLDDALSRAGCPIAAVDLRRLPRTGGVADWFSRKLKTRSIGSGFSDSLAERYNIRLAPAEAFDALLFVDSTTSARPTPRGSRVRPVSAAASSNFDFESGAIGSSPPGWTGPERLQADNYRAETRRDEARSGSRCGVIRRLAGPAYGETIGPLDQLLDAAPYRGKRIRLSADVRIDPGATGDEAYLRLQSLVSFGRRSLGKGMYDHPITDRSWRRYTVEGDVPADAGTLAVGVAFAGNGSAWVDNVSLEIVQPKTP